MRAVLAACRRLGIDGDARKDLQLEVIGVASMAHMSDGQLGRLLDHLNRDWKRGNQDRPHIGKIKALWWSLYWLGAVGDPGDRAISAFVQRQTGISALRFLDHTRAHSVIEALKDWLAREGVVWPESLRGGDGRAERFAVIDAIAGRFSDPAVTFQATRRGLGLPDARALWSERELDDLIRQLGKQLRAASQ
ncbi:regulatory protein GemA [Alteriqipengyuania flavescens]|nr:regulatory protein GemA [Alteriqipengyuania flavescens]WJY24644.1 regulatory protein GemA [Alteriqipengyuania flavescens]